MKQKQTGFTMIEIALTITLLGILVVSALPAFLNITTQARQASRNGVVGAIRSGINLYRTNDLVSFGPPGNWPATLDAIANGPCGAAAHCFESVLMQGITDGNWSKTNGTTYVYNDGTDTFTYTYNPATGSFSSPDAP